MRQRAGFRRRRGCLGVERVENRVLMSIDVINTNDDGPGSLRQAIIASDAISPALPPQTIDFRIGGGTQAILPLTPLPAVTRPVIIDATAPIDHPTQLVELLGNRVMRADPSSPVYGLGLVGGGITVEGLVVGGFKGAFDAGIALFGSSNGPNGLSGDVIQSDYLGSDPAGDDLGNFFGLVVQGSSGNTIGGTADGSGNLISANSSVGVIILSNAQAGTATANLLQGNRIGTNPTGAVALPNKEDGVRIVDSPTNTVGGSVPGSGNLISGNFQDGVLITGSGSTGNLVIGDTIGTDLTGSTFDSNGRDGVGITDASGNTVGGEVLATRNLISGNGFNGVAIRASGSTTQATGNLVEGNFIGPDITGTGFIYQGNGNLAQGNLQAGVLVDGSSGDTSNNTIGGTTPGAGNVISGNSREGIEVIGSSFNANTESIFIEGNDIGVGFGRVQSLANFGSGILLQAALGVVIGGTDRSPGDLISKEGNIVSNNGRDGIQMLESNNNLIQGNIIGSSLGGLDDQGNVTSGISDTFGISNTIGGTVGLSLDTFQNTAGNLILGSGGSGIQVSGSQFDLIQGNQIGLNANSSTFGQILNPDGTLSVALNGDGTKHQVGNDQDGITFNADSISNTVGGAGEAGRNVISGNLKNGISLDNGSSSNTIQGNEIGTNAATPTAAAGTSAAGNGLNGIYLTTQNNTIGGSTPGDGNTISANAVDGVVLSGASATLNVLEGNRIGTDALGGEDATPGQANLGIDGMPIGNRSNGVMLINDAALNSIGGTQSGQGNVISGNGSNGVLIFDINYNDGFSSKPGNILLNNVIGLTHSGENLDGNGGDGVLINSAQNNSVGGPSGFGFNVISGNGGNGVNITGPTSLGNVVQGDLIGLDLGGQLVRGNLLDGVSLSNASYNTIGGSTPGAGNVISGNVGDGVGISSVGGALNAVFNLVSSNNIGLASDGKSLLINDQTRPISFRGNLGDGIRLTHTNSDDPVGITYSNLISANTISSNGVNGLDVIGKSKTFIQGNRIGTDVSGNLARGNRVGILLEGSPNITIGGPGQGNLISSNFQVGIQVNPSTIAGTNLSETIQSNFIGTQAGGVGILGNGVGIYLNNVTNVTIGGTATGQGNVISGNTNQGVVLGRVDSSTLDGQPFSPSSGGDAVEGNIIGLDFSGQVIPAPEGVGQPIGLFLANASNNTIGGSSPGAGNLISGNTKDGISIFGEAVGFYVNNLVQGNTIGPDGLGRTITQVDPATGQTFPLQGVGVLVSSSNGNTIGGLSTTGTPGNVISGNVVGVELVGIATAENLTPNAKTPTLIPSSKVPANTVQGNSLVNNLFGLFINGSAYNLVGGTDKTAANNLSNNETIGLSILGSSSQYNTVENNQINRNGASAANLKAKSTVGDGIFIDQASSNVIQSNTITFNGIGGPSANSLRNGVGVYLNDHAFNNLVGGNTITNNTAYGVFLYNSAPNIGQIQRSGTNANTDLNNGIADFREFTQLPAAPKTKTKKS